MVAHLWAVLRTIAAAASDNVGARDTGSTNRPAKMMVRAKIGNATPESHVSYSDTQRSNRRKISRGNDGNESGTRTETASSNEKRDAAFLPNVVYIGLT